MMNATYTPEDNKLRLYASSRLDAETYAQVKAAGFKWAPKQELFVAPMWTPEREDLLLDLCGEIDDEDYSPLERAADRAERFSDYRDKRASEAGASADAFDAGPSSFGHQNRQRAERQAARHDRHRTYAVSQWSKAEYWQERTKAVIGHALYKSSAKVRRSRILRIEADQRKNQKNRDEYAARYAAWVKVPALEGADKPGRYVSTGERIGFDPETMTPALRLAYTLANYGACMGKYQHPRAERVASLYDLLIGHDADPITPAEAAALWLADRTDPSDPDSNAARWARHYELRLSYERAMLAEEGGTAADADMVPGGWIGRHQIHAVNRSPVTGKVVSVKLMGEKSGYTPESDYKEYKTVPCLVTYNIERLPEGAYRAPTDEEAAAFATAQAEAKAERKASKPKAPALVNPTDEDAHRLQDLWNEKAKTDHIRAARYGECPVSTVWRMTQAEYSQRSKGSYGTCETSDITEQLKIRRQSAMCQDVAGRVVVFKVRTGSAGGFSLSSCRRVIILTDKPQKPIPWNAIDQERAEQPTVESMTPKLHEVARVLALNWMPTSEDDKQLIDDAVYLGWAFVSSQTQFGFTKAGAEVFKEYVEQNPAGKPETSEPTTDLFATV